VVRRSPPGAKPTVANGFVYRAAISGAHGDDGLTTTPEPSWPTTPGATVTDNVGAAQITWERFGSENASFARVFARGAVETSDATSTECDRYTLVDATRNYVEVKVSAVEDAAPDAAYFVLYGVWDRVGNTVTQVQASTVRESYPNTAGTAWTAALSVSGNDVRVMVTGDTAKTIRWKVLRAEEP
jgi:hypothetical protein